MGCIVNMKCLNCGNKNTTYICDNCKKIDIWSSMFKSFFPTKYKPSENEYVIEFINSFESIESAREKLPEIIDLFDVDDKAYYMCRYEKGIKAQEFEATATRYLEDYQEWDYRKQMVLLDLLNWYGTNDFESPEKWCEFIEKTNDLYVELYSKAAEYRAKVGDYDLAEADLKKAYEYCKKRNSKFFFKKENLLIDLDKLSRTLVTYRAGKPYMPKSEEAQQKILAIYERKAIRRQHILSRSKKIAEKDFQMPTEYIGDILDDYCAFWCTECFSTVKAKDIYEIAAVRVRNNKKVDTYRSFIKPWDVGTSAKKAAAKEAGITEEELNKQRTVDVVMKEFFEFVGEDILVSTDAMGKQRDYLSRAARYAQMSTIKNNLLDILYYAEDISEKYEGKNNTRNHIMEDLKVKEGKNSLERAVANHQLYQKLKKLEK